MHTMNKGHLNTIKASSLSLAYQAKATDLFA